MDETIRECLLHKALGVEEFPEKFDPNKIPETGEEYLHSVMYEAMHCENFVTSSKNFEKFRGCQTLFTEVKPCEVVPERCIYKDSWQSAQLADFSAFRNHVQKMQLKYMHNPDMPFSGEPQVLYKRCSVVPKASDLLNLMPKHITKLLEVYVKWFSEHQANGLPYSYNVWLYGILSCIPMPIWPNNSSLLRELGRNISKILANLPEDTSEEILIPLNIFICIIVKYFKNYDLLSIV